MYPTNCWYAVLDAREVRPGRPHVATRFGLELAFWRDAAGAPRCVLDRCPHRGASLGAGRVRGGEIECPFHGFRFDGSGACVEVPCNPPDNQRPRHLATRAFELREAHGLIWLWWGEARETYPAVPWFEDLDERYGWAGFAVDSVVSWTRNVENQLDWAHLPFVHRTSIGAEFPHEIEVHSDIEGDRLTTWVDDQLELSFHFPNIWKNPFGGERLIGFMAFAPVDETHSRLYVRTYARVPVLARFVARVTNIANRWILGQDLRVVHTQPPESTAGLRDEKLVQSDLSIAQFRKELVRRSDSPGPLVELRTHDRAS
jgi:phenylpropionate dioxygenase-like ring-hydroxylating dioxygenase large terminal subunit